MSFNSTDKSQSSTINLLRATAIILVVLHHSISYVNKLDVTTAYSNFITIISAVHVPLFFMISGYLCHTQNVFKYYKKKILQILVPFLLFTSLKLVVNLFSDQFSHAETVGDEILKAYVYGEYYWFSYALLIMIFLAPFLWKLKNKIILVFLFFVETKLGANRVSNRLYP